MHRMFLNLSRFSVIEQLYLFRKLLQHFLFSMLGMLIFVALMQSAIAGAPGRFEIIDADFRVDEGIWVADVRAGLELSEEALQALDNGVALSIQYQFKVVRQRSFWTDKVIVEPKQNIQLQYLSLSRRYLVQNLNTGEQLSYATLFSALRQIGQIQDFPIMAAADIDQDAKHYFSTRVVLNREKLPGPLQVLVFWRGDFSLDSEWYRWTLK